MYKKARAEFLQTTKSPPHCKEFLRTMTHLVTIQCKNGSFLIILLRFEAILGFKVYYQTKEGVTEQKGPSLYSSPPQPTLFCDGFKSFQNP